MAKPLFAVVFVVAISCVALTSAQASPGQRLFVQGQVVNLRAAPNTEARVIRKLARGTAVMEFARQDEWVKVGVFRTVGEDGWVLDTLLGPQPPGQAAADELPEVVRGRGQEQSRPTQTVDTRPLFLLDIGGSPARQFRGDCVLARRDGSTERKDIRGTTPKTIRIRAQGASCLVQKFDASGRLRVKLIRDGIVIAAKETAAAFNWVRVRSDGPWGKARAVRGDQPLIRLKTPPRRQVVPPLTGNPVPPLTGNPVPPLTGNPVPPLSR